jgi:hypothetical protein
MISILSKSTGFFSNLGLEHFIERTGLPVNILQCADFPIVISYGNDCISEDQKITIQIAENQIEDKICGEISGFSGSIPISQIAHDTGSGDEVIFLFKNDNLQYPCITQKNGKYFVGIDIFNETGYMLSGHFDAIEKSLDQTIKNQMAALPSVDFLEDILLEIIKSACSKRNLPLIQKSYWPDGKTFAVCPTHDVDELTKTYQWISRPIRFIIRRDYRGFKGQILSFIQKIKGLEPYYTYDDIIGIEKSLGIKSTYFILKETGKLSLNSKKSWYLYGRNRSFKSPEMQALIHRLIANGDEIGVHGSYFSYANPGLFVNETKELENITGEAIKGNRQHNLNIDIPKTWEYHIMAGLIYDTSLGFKDSIGFRWGTTYPFYPNNGKEILPLVEIPLAIMDICLDSYQDKELECIKLADVAERFHGVLTLLWHPPVFNTLEFPDAREIYIYIIQYCRDRNAWIARAKDIAEWINFRKGNDFTLRYEGKSCIIIPNNPESMQFLTITHPADSKVILISNNVEIIKKENDCVHIKTINPQCNFQIVMEIT